MIEIAIINKSSVVKDEDMANAVSALQIQVSRDFAPIWGIDAKLRLDQGNDSLGASQLVVLDTSDDAQYLAYHDLTPDGFPLGKVFAKSDIDSGDSWTVTLSHELLEMLVDPSINLVVEADDDKGRAIFYAYEVCDAVEGDQFGYEIDGVKVSNFVTPKYFETFHKPPTQYDFRNLLPAHIPAMLEGGYLSKLDPRSSKGWTQIAARECTPAMRARVGSRRERRRLPRDQWIRSKALPFV